MQLPSTDLRPPVDEIAELVDLLCAKSLACKREADVVDRVLMRLVRPNHHGYFWGDRMLTLDKAAAFRDDPAFQAALARADSSTGQNQYASPDGISWRYHTLIWAARCCLCLPGDFVECGVYRGDMTWMVTETVDLQGAGKRFYLYDTFAGFDPRYSSPADFPDAPHFFDIADQIYKHPGIEAYVRQRFANKPNVVVTRGTVPDVLADVSPAQIAFLHLDMNSPAAEIGALEVLFDRVMPGGMIVLDDYGWALYRMQRCAADQFMAARGLAILELPTGQGLAVKC
ncbi:MAG TPA: TylF/MycF/NovP-related O-methyltransferase [Hyphomicrobiaceae bacterium]|nr:TylF/MycF/NovP-related O-methyltransferase [Hyphomicrobiaceae bacterium]